MYRTRTSVLPGLGTTTPVGDVSATDWNLARGDISTLQVGQTRTNLRSAGLSLDGTTDETVALQAIIDNASNGEILVLDERAQLNVSEQVLISGKQVSIEGYGDAKLQATSVLTVPILRIVNAPGAHIDTVEIVGAETSFIGGASTRYAVEVELSPDASLRNVSMSGSSRGARLYQSDKSTVHNLVYQGMATAPGGGVNFHTTLNVDDCDDTRVDGIAGYDVGSVILAGMGSIRGTVDRLLSRNAYDNAAYISSGEGWQLSNPIIVNDTFSGVGGMSGVKFRGRDHVLLGGYIHNVGTAIAMSDASGLDVGDGAGGTGSKAIGTRVVNAWNLGVGIEQEYQLPPRDMSVLFCEFENCNAGNQAGLATIRALHGFGHQFIGNRISNQIGGRAGILAEGTTAAELTGVTTMLNKFRDVATIGVRYGYVNGGMIAYNELQNVTGTFGLYLDAGADANDVYGNKGIGTVGTVAGIRAVAGSGTNRITDNPRLTVQDFGTGNVMFGNANGNPSITGSRGGNAALADLISKLVAQGVITDSTTA